MPDPYRDNRARDVLVVELPWTALQRVMIPLLTVIVAAACAFAWWQRDPTPAVLSTLFLVPIPIALRVFRFEVDLGARVLRWKHRLIGISFGEDSHPLDDVRDIRVITRLVSNEDPGEGSTYRLAIRCRDGTFRDVATAFMLPETMEELAARLRAAIEPHAPALDGRA